MQRKIGNKVWVSAAAAFLAVVAALAVGSSAAKRQSVVSASRGDSVGRGDAGANDARTLKEKAKGSRQYVEHESNKAPAYATLNELAGRSSAVIIGTPQENVCRLSPDGKSVTIDYKVSVSHVYKGGLKEGEVVTVSLPGGVAVLDDGTRVEVKTPWFKKMQGGKTYALFLGPVDGREAFAPAGGPQGVFEIPVTKESRNVKSHSGLRSDPMWAYHDMGVMAFLKEVRKATGK